VSLYTCEKNTVVPVYIIRGIWWMWRYNSIHSSLALEGGEWPTSHPSYLTLKERPPLPSNIQSIGGWEGPLAGIDILVKTKISYLCQESNPG